MYAFSFVARDPKILQLIIRDDSGFERSLVSIANGKIYSDSDDNINIQLSSFKNTPAIGILSYLSL